MSRLHHPTQESVVSVFAASGKALLRLNPKPPRVQSPLARRTREDGPGTVNKFAPEDVEKLLAVIVTALPPKRLSMLIV